MRRRNNWAKKCTFCPSPWISSLCKISATQWQRTSRQQSCLFKKIVHAAHDIAKLVRIAFSRNKHDVVAFFYARHNGRNRRFHLPTDSVATNGVSVLFADGKPHLRLRLVAFAVQQNKVFVGNALSVFVNVVVLIVFFKSVTRLQNDSSLSSRKRVTTLVSSSGKRSASTGSFHSCAKTVHFASLSFFGLIGSFHICFSLFSAHFARFNRNFGDAEVSKRQQNAPFHNSIRFILPNCTV